MRTLRPSELRAILPELQRQVKLEQYAKQRDGWAFMAAVVANGFAGMAGKRGKAKPEDFMGKEALAEWRKLAQGAVPAQARAPQDWSEHIAQARAKGLRGI